MSYSIRYSEEAKQDLRNIYVYIAFKLQSPDIAAGQYARITEAIRKLDEMPLRFPLYQDESWSNLEMRWFPVDNYLVFYLVDTSKEDVSIIRIMYKGRDISAQLNS